MKVLITGGLGGFGRYIAKELLNAGHSITILAHKSKKSAEWFPPECIRYGDIMNPETYLDLLPQQDAIIHLAFILHPYSETHPKAYEINVTGTQTLINAVELVNPNCRFIFSSTVMVFGYTSHETPPLKADHAVQETSKYTAHKIICENLLKQSKLNWVILRIAEGLYLELVPSITNVNRIFDFAWDQRVEFIHLQDCAVAFRNALTADCVHRILIIGGGPRNQFYFYDQIRHIMKKVFFLTSPHKSKFNPNHNALDWYDTSESQRLLQFQSKTLEDYISDLKKNTGKFTRFLYWTVSPLASLIVKYAYQGYRSPKN